MGNGYSPGRARVPPAAPAHFPPHFFYSTAAHIPPGQIWSSNSVGQYGCVSAGLCQMGCKCDPNGAKIDQKWSSNDAQMDRGGTTGAQMSPSEVSVKLTWAQWGRNQGRMGPNEARVRPRWGLMTPKRSPNGAQWDPNGGKMAPKCIPKSID